MEFNLDQVIEKAPEFFVTYGLKLLMAIVVYVIGKWLANAIANGLMKGLNSRKVDPTIGRFTRNIVYYVLLVIVVIATLSQLGIQTASFVAVLGAAGLAIGFALQGSLANFAAGVLLILFRPFKVGDYVEAGGSAGVVKEISIFSTILTTPDNKVVTIANNAVMGNIITNYSAMATRRVDLVVGVGYGSNLALVKQTLQEIADADERVLKDPAVTIGCLELADSSVNFAFRCWVDTANFWPVKFALTEKIKTRFDEVGIEIPFPQLDVHHDK
ncbi:MAG: mechanosensitive ion channel [Gammaproteobacteria bacterium]|nr:mechanosensitive ion channel [Gammaproteobacteria bacterium]